MEWYYPFINSFFCFVVGAFVSFVELYSRYDNPKKILTNFSSITHIGVNGLTAVLAFVVIRKNNLMSGEVELNKVLIASTSSLLLLRSSFANLKIKGETFDAGVSSVIQVLLKTCERSFDRERTQEDLAQLDNVMNKVVFDKAYIDLPLLCLEKMGSLSAEEYNQLGKDIAKLKTDSTNIAKTKSLVLGAKISKLTGMDVLVKGVSLLRPEIETPDQSANDLLNKLEEKQKELQKKITE